MAELKKRLAAPNLSDEDKAKLQNEQATYEEHLATLRVGSERVSPDIASRVIVAWKIEHELQRVYGGRVIFQQFGPEALDARRRLFEQAEKNGDLEFDDAGVRHMFYYYANMKHTFVDEKALERPWFFGDRQ